MLSLKEKGVAHDVPDDQIKLRLQSALVNKLQKYNDYRLRGWIGAADGYIVALNAARVPCAMLERTVPRIVASVFPIGIEVVHLDRETLRTVDVTYQYQDSIQKKVGKSVPTTSFLNEAYKGISSVLYSHADAYNRPTNTGGDFVVVHNPLADVPLSLGLLKKGREFQANLNDPRVLKVHPTAWDSMS
jgi:type I restriction enzyme S subunit